MNIEEIEKKLEILGYWLLRNKNNLFQIQNFRTGEIENEIFNLEALENKLEALEKD